MDADIPSAANPAGSTAAPLSALAARVLGCLIEKEFATPDVYPLTLNALVNACNQKNNRDPVMSVTSREVEIALEELRLQKLAVVFAGADARVAKYKQKIDAVYPMQPDARAMMGELLLRGAQTAAGLRGNAERLCAMPDVAEIETILIELAGRPSGALVRKLARQPGQKEARWVQLLTGEPSGAIEAASAAAPLTVTMTLPPEVEARFAALEGEVRGLKDELARLRASLGEPGA
ncbi:MAG TPA: YceH family protein [Candidatus Didemnitutus sp.]|nr:YceH family protein [Candidatus Didemnitutus sp.]